MNVSYSLSAMNVSVSNGTISMCPSFSNGTNVNVSANSSSQEWWTQMVPGAWWVVLVLILLCVFTVVSNFLIILAFISAPRLRHPFNYFLLNMAVSDVLVGAIGISLSIVYEYFKYWPLNGAVCSFYIFFDYTASNVSVWTLVIVAIDRLWAVQWPIAYRRYNKTPKALIGISLSWIIVNATILPGFIYTRMTFGNLTEKEKICAWEHEGLPVFASSFPTSVFNGWIPTPIVITCYILTLIKIFKQSNLTQP